MSHGEQGVEPARGSGAPGPAAEPLAILRKARQPDGTYAPSSSWIGGLPRLGTTPWPRDRSERAPLHFLGQLDLADISGKRPGTGLPSSGSLAFFLDLGGETLDAAVLLVPGHMTAPEAPLPQDMGPIWGRDWRSCAFATDMIPGRAFPAWPVEFVEIEVDRREYRSEEARTRAFLAGICGPNLYNLSLSLAKDEFPRGREPYLWHSLHRLADWMSWKLEALDSDADTSLDHIRRTLANPPRRWSDEKTREFEARRLRLEEGRETCRAFLVASEAWARSEPDPWKPIGDADILRLRETGKLVRETFVDFFLGGPLLLSRLADRTLLAMAHGEAEVFRKLPQSMRDRINGPYRAANDERTHQVFGFGAEVQNEVSDNRDENVMLCQFAWDDFMGWRFGDVGAVRFWIPKDAFRRGDWSRAFVTSDSN